MRDVLKQEREEFKYRHKKMNEKYEGIMQKKKVLAIENAVRLDKLRKQLESSVKEGRNLNAYATEVKHEIDTWRQKSSGISSQALKHA